jgi:hypothetical protein
MRFLINSIFKNVLNMKHKEIEFDDVVIEENGTWSQICDSCIENHIESDCLDELPIANLICGVKGCNNEATHYIDFKYEKQLD